MSEFDKTQILPPVGPYSPPEAIMAWLDELQAMTGGHEVQRLIEQAREWLEVQKSYMAIA